ncbi:MAG: family 43 glycosylhydrolase, partial [Chloroflexi bacterium]|nr:family 43 glycosylhydrolase [Chloroflexota bacterium]
LARDSRYDGHTEIWMQELDLQTMRLAGEPQVIWDGDSKTAMWSEGPHLYKIDGRYYLLTAEGGTGHHHSVVVARSDAIGGPYVNNPGNPVLTHRHLGWNYPIVGTGHADLVETQNGEWWMVLLAMRPDGGYYHNLGRETFLARVTWEDGWPIVNAGIGQVEFTQQAPDLPEHDWPPVPDRDDFDHTTLAPQWVFLRTPRENFWSLTDRAGYLQLRLRPQRLAERVNPSFVGRRQQHIQFSAQTLMEFTPQSEHECAGLALVQNNDFNFCFVVTRTDQPVIRLIKRAAGVEEILAEQPIAAGRCYLKVEAYEQAYSFFVATEPEQWRLIAGEVDGRILSTQLAGGFVGAMIALYASSNGQASANTADFDWFEYRGLAETALRNRLLSGGRETI